MRTIDLDSGITPEDVYDEIQQAMDSCEDLFLTREDGRGALVSTLTLNASPGSEDGTIDPLPGLLTRDQAILELIRLGVRSSLAQLTVGMATPAGGGDTGFYRVVPESGRYRVVRHPAEQEASHA